MGDKGDKQEFFRFYRGYADASREMKPKTRGQFLCALVDYMLYDETPEFKPGTTAAAVWVVTKKSLDKSKQYSKNGRGNRNNDTPLNASPATPPTEDEVSAYLRTKAYGTYAPEKARQFCKEYSQSWNEVISRYNGNWRQLCDEWLSGNVNNTETDDNDLPNF